MAIVLDTTLVTTGVRAAMGGTSDQQTLVIAGITAGSTNLGAVTGSGLRQNVTVAGHLWSASDSAVYLDGNDAVVNILSGGSAVSASSTWLGAVSFEGQRPQLTNMGDILGATGVQIGSIAQNAMIVNAGNIVATGRGLTPSLVAAGILIRSDGGITLNIDNSGLIAGSVNSNSDTGAQAGRIFAIREVNNSNNINLIDNSGTLQGDVSLRAGNDRLTNTGLVAGSVEMGTGNDRVENTGEITGAVDIGLGNDTIENSGTIGGNVILNDGSNLLVNAGLIQGRAVVSAGETLNANNVVNTGTILGDPDISEGLSISGTQVRVFNSGTILGPDKGVAMTASVYGEVINSGAEATIRGGEFGVQLVGGANTRALVENAGEIGGHRVGVQIEVGSYVNLTNTGTITGVATDSFPRGDGVRIEGRSIDFLNSGSVIGGDSALLAAASDDIAITNTGLMAATSANGNVAIRAIMADAIRFVNTGEVLSAADGVDIRAERSAEIRNDGQIAAVGTALNAESSGIEGAVAVINNGGLSGEEYGIRAGSLSGMPFADTIALIRNTGTISGVEGNVVAAERVVLDNDGLIEGATNGLLVGASELSMVNAGRIVGSLAGGLILLDYDGAAHGFSVVNTGQIISNGGIGLQAQGDLTLRNSGLIQGEDWAVRSSYQTASITEVPNARPNDILNAGVLLGGVLLGDGDDRFDSRLGEVSGVIEMGGGDDTVMGSRFDDEILGGSGSDRMFGMDGDDLLFGEGGNDTIFGGAGDDTIFGGINQDQIFGGSGDDELHGDSGSDLIRGGPGDDTIFGGTADDTLYGDGGDDVIFGGSNADLIFGGSGHDELHGDSGFDTLYGGAGNDTLYGGTADDMLYGGSGDDLIYGGANDDTLRGETGNDTLFGDSGNNLMYGGSGDDVIHGGTGTDTMYGGWGADVFVWTDAAQSVHGAGRDTVMDFTPGQDRIDLSAIMDGLTWIGTSAYSGSGGEVRYNPNISGGTVTRLYIDLDGNPGSNFSVDLIGGPVLSAADVIL